MIDDHREERAKSLLQNELFNEAFDVLRKDLMIAGTPVVLQNWKLGNQSGLRCDCLTNFMDI